MKFSFVSKLFSAEKLSLLFMLLAVSLFILNVAMVQASSGETATESKAESTEQVKKVMAADADIDPADGAPFDLADPERIAKGKKQFNTTCAAWCHGQNPVLFVGRTGLTEKYVYETIRDGGGGNLSPMPSWGTTFTPEEIWQLVSYIKSLGKW